MPWWDPLLQWLLGSSQAIFGFVMGSILAGWLTWKWVIPRALKDPKIARFLITMEKLAKHAEKIVENQEKDKE